MIVQLLYSVLIIQFLITMFSNAIKSLSSRLRKNDPVLSYLASEVLEIPDTQRSWYGDGAFKV